MFVKLLAQGLVQSKHPVNDRFCFVSGLMGITEEMAEISGLSCNFIYR